MQLQDKVALVTGGTQGIGYAIAEGFLRQGAKVAISGRSQEKCDASAKALSLATGGECIGLRADVSVGADVELMFSKLLDSLKKIDILVNNAGITKDSLIVRMSEQDFDEVVATNLKGAFLCTKAACKVMMKQRQGSIINIASIVGVIGNAGQANYCASKAGLIGLAKSVAKELASRNVRANALAPGFITTAMTEDLSPEARAGLLAQIPLGRFGDPADIAEACVFLASDASRYMTGQVMRVDGGMFM